MSCSCVAIRCSNSCRRRAVSATCVFSRCCSFFRALTVAMISGTVGATNLSRAPMSFQGTGMADSPKPRSYLRELLCQLPLVSFGFHFAVQARLEQAIQDLLVDWARLEAHGFQVGSIERWPHLSLGGHVGRDQTHDILGPGLGDEQDETFVRQVGQGSVRFRRVWRPA